MLYNLERVNGSTGLCQNGIVPQDVRMWKCKLQKVRVMGVYWYK